MDVVAKIVLRYLTANGRCPYSDWFSALQDKRTQAIVDARLTRLEAGNFGKCRSVGTGVMELKIDFGPGYRVYFGQDGDALVILLCGGDKSSQNQDIEQAQLFWQDYRNRKEKE